MEWWRRGRNKFFNPFANPPPPLHHITNHLNCSDPEFFLYVLKQKIFIYFFLVHTAGVWQHKNRIQHLKTYVNLLGLKSRKFAKKTDFVGKLPRELPLFIQSANPASIPHSGFRHCGISIFSYVLLFHQSRSPPLRPFSLATCLEKQHHFPLSLK